MTGNIVWNADGRSSRSLARTVGGQKPAVRVLPGQVHREDPTWRSHPQGPAKGHRLRRVHVGSKQVVTALVNTTYSAGITGSCTGILQRLYCRHSTRPDTPLTLRLRQKFARSTSTAAIAANMPFPQTARRSAVFASTRFQRRGVQDRSGRGRCGDREDWEDASETRLRVYKILTDSPSRLMERGWAFSRTTLRRSRCTTRPRGKLSEYKFPADRPPIPISSCGWRFRKTAAAGVVDLRHRADGGAQRGHR